MPKLEVIYPPGCPTLPWAKIRKMSRNRLKGGDRAKTFAGLDASYARRKYRIPLFLWLEGDLVIDGAGRCDWIQAKADEGWDIPDLPVIQLPAETQQEAEELAATVSSQFDDPTEETWTEFTKNWKLGPMEMKSVTAGLRFPTLDLGSFVSSHSRKGSGEDPGPADPPKKPKTRLGDLYILGEHRLVCGDSFVAEDRAKLYGEHPPSMVLSDPPYAIYGSSTGIAADITDDRMVIPFFENLCRIVIESIPEFGHAYLCTDWRSWSALWIGARAAGLVAKNCIVWDKGGGLGNVYQMCHEFCGFFHRLPPERSMASGRVGGQRHTYGPNIVRHNRVMGEEREHNAQKPVAMLVGWIEASSDEGDGVLDLFGGSGSTLIACEQTGRACRMMEMEPKFCDVIVDRWEKMTGQKAERIRAKK